jgi:hypothetical protein
MQSLGFIMMFLLFLICGAAYPTLTASAAGLHAFQFLYFFSSFWNQFGPNCTTWLVAGRLGGGQGREGGSDGKGDMRDMHRGLSG